MNKTETKKNSWTGWLHMCRRV